MPEARESKASFLITGAAVTDAITSGVHLHLECIKIDTTTKKGNQFKKDHPAHAALPYTIDTICTVKCGMHEAQALIDPPMWRTTSRVSTRCHF
jgi:hypothetical protein